MGKAVIAAGVALALAASVSYGMLYAVKKMDECHYNWDDEENHDDD